MQCALQNNQNEETRHCSWNLLYGKFKAQTGRGSWSGPREMLNQVFLIKPNRLCGCLYWGRHYMKAYLINPRTRCVTAQLRRNCGGLFVCPQRPCLEQIRNIILVHTTSKMWSFYISLSNSVREVSNCKSALTVSVGTFGWEACCKSTNWMSFGLIRTTKDLT